MKNIFKEIDSFEKIISPIAEELFFNKYHDIQHLHIPSLSSKNFADLFSWDDLNYLLNMTSIWTSLSLNLVLDKKKIPPEEYCQITMGRDGNQVHQPNSEKVMQWLNQGATLIANDVDALNPAISSIANILESELSSKAQCNIYFSAKDHQGFDVHFDMHEVFALHLIGEKKWKLYEKRLENPINNEQFQNMLEPDFCRRNCGNIKEEIIMKPGDVLYIPRGQFHEALASSDSTAHLTFGITHAIGHDFLSLVYEEAMSDPAFRSNFPLPTDGGKAREQWIKSLSNKLFDIAKDRNIANRIEKFSENFRYKRGGYNLTNEISKLSKNHSYILSSRKISLTKKNGSLYLQDSKQAIKIPKKIEELVAWIFKQNHFLIKNLTSQFPNFTEEEILTFVKDMENMKVVVKE